MFPIAHNGLNYVPAFDGQPHIFGLENTLSFKEFDKETHFLDKIVLGWTIGAVFGQMAYIPTAFAEVFVDLPEKSKGLEEK